MKTLQHLAVAVLLCAATAAGAQVVEKKALTLEGARRIAAAAADAARAKNAGGAIAIVDDGGNLMYVERLDGTFAAGANISIGKARTAAIFRRPTSAFEEIIRNGRTPMVALDDFTPLQGGVPLELDGAVVGGIGVSGAASAPQDEEIAVAGAQALASGAMAAATSGPPAADVSPRGGALKLASAVEAGGPAAAGSSGPGVVHFDRDRVAAAFSKGEPLIELDGYKVHASRREAAGVAEVHDRDTDIIYVLDGSATLVTGGTVVDGKTTAPDEIRGPSIRGGETRRLRKGDVIVVPNGVPHWFQDVQGPLTYYVVKVG